MSLLDKQNKLTPYAKPPTVVNLSHRRQSKKERKMRARGRRGLPHNSNLHVKNSVVTSEKAKSQRENESSLPAEAQAQAQRSTIQQVRESPPSPSHAASQRAPLRIHTTEPHTCDPAASGRRRWMIGHVSMGAVAEPKLHKGGLYLDGHFAAAGTTLSSSHPRLGALYTPSPSHLRSLILTFRHLELWSTFLGNFV